MKEAIATLLKKEVLLKKSEIKKLIETPPSPEMGDYAFPCFSLSKQFKKNPNQIAEELKNKIKFPRQIEKIEVSGAYLNFFVNRKIFAKNLVNQILKQKNNFGKKKFNLKRMVEFSQPNTHKSFHVGHIRGTSLGESLARIAEFFGEKVIRANYSGDTGMHIAKWIWCYKKYHSKEKLKKDESWIALIYVDAVKKLSANEKFQKEVDMVNKKIEDKSDKEINALWKKTRQLSIDSWKKIYKELNTHFDMHYFESEVEKRGKEITKELVKKGIAKISDGATIIDFEEQGLGVLVFLRRDGTVLYAGKDLALAEKKVEKKMDWYIYVVADEQNLYLKQIFKTLELMKFKEVKKFHHVSFGLVKLPEGKMSSRTGENILYSNFLKEVTDFAKRRIKERTPKIKNNELEKRALIISVAAIKYSMLKQRSSKNIIFKKQDALNFEGDTGPYLLYSYARAGSILRKTKSKNKQFKIKQLNQNEIKIIKKLSQFPEVVLNAYSNFNPSLIANYSYHLAQIFNEFYHACPVIGSEQESFRLALVKSFKHVLENSLNLLGIETLEKM